MNTAVFQQDGCWENCNICRTYDEIKMSVLSGPSCRQGCNKGERTCEMYLDDDWFPSVILEVLRNGRVAGRVVLTVLDVTPSLQLQRQAGYRYKHVRATSSQPLTRILFSCHDWWNMLKRKSRNVCLVSSTLR